jgi:predicted DNA repair protein MutK
MILLPAGLALEAFAPWAIAPLLILGGLYLCFEGAEKVLHWVRPHAPAVTPEDKVPQDPAHLEEAKVRGAVKTDFILSAEIMTIALNEIETTNVLLQGLTLALVAVAITAMVYGAVALIVKADDMGLRMATRGRLAPTRALGRLVVRGMPGFMAFLTVVGTVAMLWVGGSIVIHSLEVVGWALPAHLIHDLGAAAGHLHEPAHGLIEWLVTATVNGGLGLGMGLAVVPVAGAMAGLIGGKGAAAH